MKRRKYSRPIRRPRNVVSRSKVKMVRKTALRKTARYLLIIILSGLVLWWGWRLVSQFVVNFEGFKISKIELLGCNNLSEKEIVTLLPFREGDNLLNIWVSDTEKELKRCRPEIKDVDIYRRLQKVVIKVDERKPIACMINTKGFKMGLDEDNMPFPLKGSLSREFLPEIVAAEESEREEILEFIKIFSEEAPETFKNIEKLYVEPVNSIVFELKNKLKVYWGRTEKDKIANKLRRMSIVMKDAGNRFSGVEYVDLCFFDDGRILIKPIKDEINKDKKKKNVKI